MRMLRFLRLWAVTVYKLWRADWLRDQLRREVEDLKRQAQVKR